MVRITLYDYIVAYILVKEITAVANTATAGYQQIKKVIFKNCVPFSSCIRRINNTQIDDAQYIVMQ